MLVEPLFACTKQCWTWAANISRNYIGYWTISILLLFFNKIVGWNNFSDWHPPICLSHIWLIDYIICGLIYSFVTPNFTVTHTALKKFVFLLFSHIVQCSLKLLFLNIQLTITLLLVHIEIKNKVFRISETTGFPTT